MTNPEKKKENTLVKVYIFILFLCGIGLWLAISNAGTPKQKLAVDVELEQKLVDALVANGVKQTDIISQYVKERETTSKEWSEFYKKIQLYGNKRPENFEDSFRSLARSMKLGLSKTDNSDGSITYKFYSSSVNYSNVTFVNSKNPVSASSALTQKTASKAAPQAAPSKAAVSTSSSSKAGQAASSSNAKNNKKKTQPKAKK